MAALHPRKRVVAGQQESEETTTMCHALLPEPRHYILYFEKVAGQNHDGK